mmetsp:Transcript_4065/g.5342  ORF Transcript_4065/g.5342 Transcript_4065/m.5342 type:complete len:316 (+) Transcript_4065:81-1028(+)|eukprot:CAMPEP_0198139014 /NCGR_PEP_ID=MMETSP1443-20131203/2344_1 /TAXON_ID=186043 /ORGANISM="Entomoneis sp., Strain CCMP2396" /LENGTH=315 /DNA_ID=CAMNT_0043800987 /DNA_START=77 /DNA_END=1024 /DNA_ORIENTATION=-
MKIALGLLALPSAFGLKKISAAAVRKIAAVRKLNDYEAEQDDYEFLQNYEQIYMTCDASMQVTDADGNIEYGAVVSRFCPNGASCDNNGNKKCDDGYGDYVVGIETYMAEFLEQFERNNQDEEADGEEDENAFDFNFAEFGECNQFELEDDGDNDGDDEDGDQAQYFIGPHCSDGDIKIALFTDEDCQYESLDVTFQDLTGVALPWSTSILEDDDCKPYYCYGMNENGEYEYNDFCTQVVEQATQKCETRMDTFSPYGKTESGCESITALLPTSSGGGAGAFIIVILVASVVGFAVFYFMQQKKKSAVNQEGLMM